MTVVDVNVLREVTNRIFDFIQRDLQLKEVALPENFYWEIPDDELYEMGEQPNQLVCGSLVDDADFVRAAYSDPVQAIPETLIHVAPLLKALSMAVPSYKSPPKK